jgi:hypothetical protein
MSAVPGRNYFRAAFEFWGIPKMYSGYSHLSLMFLAWALFKHSTKCPQNRRTMSIKSPTVFIDAAKIIIKRQLEDPTSREFKADWMAHFGTMPDQCVWIWNNLDPCKTIGKAAQCCHLLWALYFLRVYPTEKTGRSAVAHSSGTVVEKTWRKWTQDFVEAISYLESRVVSLTV